MNFTRFDGWKKEVQIEHIMRDANKAYIDYRSEHTKLINI